MRAVHLHVASAGNEVMAHIAGLFADGFRALGIEATVMLDADDPARIDAGVLPIVVAPHEYFPLHFLKRRLGIDLAPELGRVAVLNVEQPGSRWFDLAFDFAAQARHVFDISPDGVAEFERRGVRAVHAPVGYTPALQAPEVPPLASRPVDVLFLGHASPRRLAFFARHAGFFATRRCRIVLAEVGSPRRDGDAGYWSGGDRLELVASSRIVLGVHSTERQYFEQHRAMLALANRALLVTETSRHIAPLEDGVHLVSGPLDALPDLCRRHLDDSAALERVAAAGHDLVATRMRVEDSCRAVLAAVAGASAGPEAERREREAVRTRLAASRARRTRGETPWTIDANAATRGAPVPGTSVVVTSFNYARFLRQCLQSALDAVRPPGGVEIVVVDDASTDESPEVAAAVMREASTPMRLVRKHLNTGLADARNVGLAVARGRRVFVLDADNWIHPRCLTALDAAFTGEVAATYGLIARVDDQTGEGVGLLSAFEWDPRRLVEAPYIDAMALLDREAVLSVGGYSTELIDHGWFGWEDYDLWLKLAQAGRRGRLVPEIVASYRDHPASMLRRTNRESRQVSEYLRTKFAELLSRHPGLDMYLSFPSEDAGRRTPEEREHAALREHIAHLERELKWVRGSASWRLTAPLRALAGLLGGQR